MKDVKGILKKDKKKNSKGGQAIILAGTVGAIAGAFISTFIADKNTKAKIKAKIDDVADYTRENIIDVETTPGKKTKELKEKVTKKAKSAKSQ